MKRSLPFMAASPLFLVCFLFFFYANLVGQESLMISGLVIDQQSREPLTGATIAIEGTTLGTTTNDKGRFELSGITNKEITIQCTFIGYESAQITHQFALEATPNFTISLTPSFVELAQVEVQGRAEGVIKALIEQKSASNIKHVIAAEQIASFPDMNAAEAIQRIPGITLQRDQGEGRFVQLRGTPPQMTNLNINGEQVPSPEGNVRFVGMDIIAADQIEQIEVIKVATPDMDGDGIGGTVNIKTKKAETEKPDIRATLAGGYNNLRQTPNYQAQFTYGQRYGKFGFNVNSSYFQNNQGSDNLEYKYAKGPFFGSQDAGRDNYFVQYREYQLRHYDITRTRIGVSPTLDYRFNENSSIYLMAMYNSFEDDEIRRRLVYDLDDALNATYYLYGGVEHDVKSRIKKQDLSTINFGGSHQLLGATIDYQIAYAYAREREPDRLEARFDSPGQAVAIDFDIQEPDWPRASFPNENNAGNATAYDRFEMDELLLEESLVTDENLTPRLNIQLPYTFGSNHTGFFKFGGKIRLKEKERDIRAQEYGAFFETSNIYPGVAPPLSLSAVDDGFYADNLLNQGYVLDAMPSPDLIRDFFEFYPQHFIFDRNATKVQSFGEDYKANEAIYAGYGMLQHEVGKLLIVGGVRYERTDIDYEGRKILTDRGRFAGLDTLRDKRTHEFVLPQFQLKYAINRDLNIRAAWTYSYSRPNFEDVLPYREQDREEVKFGNPDLAYPLSMNLDFLVEKYFGKGLVSGGLFYKDIQDFVFYFKRFAHEGDPKDYGLVEITKAINGNKASVFGAEVQAQFKMSFLPGFLRHFGWYTNYTYTYSEALINERLPANYSDAVVVFGDDDLSVFTADDAQETITLPGQAEHTANVALFFDAPKFYARFSANYHDAFLFQLGADRDLDEYYGESLRFDFTANVEVAPFARVFIDLINLSNTPLKYYLGTPDLIQKQEYYSWWGRMGFKLDF